MNSQLVAALGAAVLGAALSGLRWLRVAQREHYLAGSVSRFAWRWWAGPGRGRDGWPARAMWLGAAAAAGLSWRWPAAEVLTGAMVAVGPLGLSLRGRSAPLRWTARLRRLAGVWGALGALALAGAAAVGDLVGGGGLGLGAVVLGVPLLGDLACWLAGPLEGRLLEPFLAEARARLGALRPVVVGITGSYGKTTTKGYLAHLLGASRRVVASPASFNNRAGLARAVNEVLAPGTEVFLAEMGTYGPGEIAGLCSWLTPSVSVITAIGPVHLERMGSEEAILAAKSEILVESAVAVLNIDDPRLAALADAASAGGRRVWRCSALDPAADVWVGDSEVRVGGRGLAGAPPEGAAPTNVACAVAAALELGVDLQAVAGLVGTLPVAPNRLAWGVSAAGVAILDDTYNSNPAGAAMALRALAGAVPGWAQPGWAGPGGAGPGGAGPGGAGPGGAGPGGPAPGGSGQGRRVVVTPGMVELGARQAAENKALARAAAVVATDLVVVGRTNRAALVAGWSSEGGPAPAVVVRDREEAVAWVRTQLGAGDAVLYENDLPDHYP